MKNFKEFLEEGTSALNDIEDKDFAKKINQIDKMTAELAKASKKFLSDNNLMNSAEIAKFTKVDRLPLSKRANIKLKRYNRCIGNFVPKRITPSFVMRIEEYETFFTLSAIIHCMSMPEGKEATRDKFVEEFLKKTVRNIAKKYGFNLVRGDQRGHYAVEDKINKADDEFADEVERPFVYFGYTLEDMHK